MKSSLQIITAVLVSSGMANAGPFGMPDAFRVDGRTAVLALVFFAIVLSLIKRRRTNQLETARRVAIEADFQQQLSGCWDRPLPEAESQEGGSNGRLVTNPLSDAQLAAAAKMAIKAGYGEMGSGDQQQHAPTLQSGSATSDYRDHSHLLNRWSRTGDRQGGWVNCGVRGWVPANKA